MKCLIREDKFEVIIVGVTVDYGLLSATDKCVAGVGVSISAFQAGDPGSSPGRRTYGTLV